MVHVGCSPGTEEGEVRVLHRIDVELRRAGEDFVTERLERLERLDGSRDRGRALPLDGLAAWCRVAHRNPQGAASCERLGKGHGGSRSRVGIAGRRPMGGVEEGSAIAHGPGHDVLDPDPRSQISVLGTEWIAGSSRLEADHPAARSRYPQRPAGIIAVGGRNRPRRDGGGPGSARAARGSSRGVGVPRDAVPVGFAG